jgi:hypothetical protein
MARYVMAECTMAECTMDREVAKSCGGVERAETLREFGHSLIGPKALSGRSLFPLGYAAGR